MMAAHSDEVEHYELYKQVQKLDIDLNGPQGMRTRMDTMTATVAELKRVVHGDPDLDYVGLRGHRVRNQQEIEQLQKQFSELVGSQQETQKQLKTLATTVGEVAKFQGLLLFWGLALVLPLAFALVFLATRVL